MNKHFSARLREAIQAMGISPTQFAYKAGIPQGTISKCLNGHVPTARILVRISKLSGKSVDWLLTGREDERMGEGYVAERSVPYGRPGLAQRFSADEGVWIAKLLRVLRSSSRRKRQTIKELLDVLIR